jgi:uncharacterized iron-regulated protein
MKKLIVLVAALFFVVGVFAQKKTPFVLYDSKGKKVSYKKMIRVLAQNDIVLFGEYHNNAIAHWLQLSVTKDLFEKRKLTLGAEMFERDNQQALDNYLQGKINAKGLDSSARLWKNYPTDYAPLVNFAKENNIPFTATNIPRKYASLVSKKGFTALDSLTTQEKSWMAPLPMAYDPELPGYKNMIAMMGGHGSENLPKAQASKDATMAHFILTTQVPGSLFIHYNGSYHSENYEGIGWYLAKNNPLLKIKTITTVSQKNIHHLESEHLNKAHYIICVDSDMTNTY